VGEFSFWYRPTCVVPDQRPLNGCVCVYFKLSTTSNGLNILFCYVIWFKRKVFADGLSRK